MQYGLAYGQKQKKGHPLLLKCIIYIGLCILGYPSLMVPPFWLFVFSAIYDFLSFREIVSISSAKRGVGVFSAYGQIKKFV